MEEKNRNTLIQRIVYLLLAALSLAFGITWPNRFCLGDEILGALGLPAWSKGAQGLHYPAIPSLIGTTVFFYLFSATTKNPKKAMGKLFVGTIVLMYILSLLFRV